MFSYLKTQLWIFIKLKFQFFNWIFTSLSQVLWAECKYVSDHMQHAAHLILFCFRRSW